MLPGYDPVVIATGRFIAFGLVTLPLWWAWRREFAHYSRQDWFTAAELGVLGNCVYYWCLTQCIQKAGAPFAGMCMALIPVLVAEGDSHVLRIIPDNGKITIDCAVRQSR